MLENTDLAEPVGCGVDAVTFVNTMAGRVVDRDENTGVETSSNRFSSSSARRKSVPLQNGTFASNPSMYNVDPPQIAIFDLSEREELHQLNNLLSGAKDEDPSVLILSMQKEFYQGKFSVCVIYRKVWYISRETDI